MVAGRLGSANASEHLGWAWGQLDLSGLVEMDERVDGDASDATDMTSQVLPQG